MTAERVLALPVYLGGNSDCQRCAGRLEEAIAAEKGVASARVDAGKQTLFLQYDSDFTSIGKIEARAKEVGAYLAAAIVHETYDLSGLDCADCAAKVEKTMARLPGVLWAGVSFPSCQMHIEYEEGKLGRRQIIRRLGELGYGVYSYHLRGEGSTLEVKVSGMDCADCTVKVEKVATRVPGVLRARVDFPAARLALRYQEGLLSIPFLLKALEEAGYPSTVEGAEGEERVTWWRRRLKDFLTALSGLALIAGIAFLLAGFSRAVTIPLFSLAIAAGGFYVARSGLLALRARTVDMNLLMTVAVAGAIAIGEWEEAASVVFLFSLANLLQGYSMERTRKAIRSLMRLSPKTALVRRQGEEVSAPVEEVGVGEVIIVKPGQRIPMDGRIVAGSSTVNEAPITGESIPREKKPGYAALAGSLNEQGVLEIRVTRPYRETVLAKIIHKVEEAQAQRAPSQQFVDRFARYYTPAVVATAFVVALLPPLALGYPFRPWVYRALALLVVACPCALVLSTPISIVSAISNAARKGILIKGGAYLEELGRVKTVAFDKTGTLTWGCVYVSDIVPLNGASAEVLGIAASLERRADHPAARAILFKASELGIKPQPIQDFEIVPGVGAKGRLDGREYYIGKPNLFPSLSSSEIGRLHSEGKMVVAVGEKDSPIGLIALFDDVRSSAEAGIVGLRGAGVRHLVMLTGDSPAPAQAIATKLGIPDFHADLLPEDKIGFIKGLREKEGRVAMVGDGVNDAPALAAASVGIAMGSLGADVALETADVVLMSDDLGKLGYGIKLSRRTLGIIKQNVAFSLGVKAALLLLLIPGWLTLWLAVLGDMGTSLAVIANATRLLRANGEA